jgi:putative Mg2+ transporter-C (MgtC) family protein
LAQGAILHGTGMIRGMTTAATIWAIAAIGMIVGIGHVGSGLGLALLVRMVLSFALRWEGHTMGGERESRVQVVFDANGGKTRVQIEKVLEDYHIGEPLAVDGAAADGRVRATFQYRLHRRHGRELLDELARMPGVMELKELKP